MAGTGSTILNLMHVQVGKQTAWDTAVVATVKRVGVYDLKIDQVVKAETFMDRRGSLAPGYLTAITEAMPTAQMDEYGSYEDVLYTLEGLLGIATPSGIGPYTRNYAAPTVALAVNPRWQSLSYGDATNNYRLIGATPSKLTIKGENGKPMTISSDMFGRDFGEVALVSNLLDRSVQLCMGDHMTVAIDAWAGTIGATPLSCTSYAYELTLDSKRVTDQFLGAIVACNYHDADGGDGWETSLKLSLEFNASSKAQWDALIAYSSGIPYQRQVRLKSQSGTNILQFDFAGYSAKAPTYGEDRNGVLIYQIELTGLYNPTLGNYFKAQSVNSVATLT